MAKKKKKQFPKKQRLSGFEFYFPKNFLDTHFF